MSTVPSVASADKFTFMNLVRFRFRDGDSHQFQTHPSRTDTSIRLETAWRDAKTGRAFLLPPNSRLYSLLFKKLNKAPPLLGRVFGKIPSPNIERLMLLTSVSPKAQCRTLSRRPSPSILPSTCNICFLFIQIPRIFAQLCKNFD